MKNDETHLVRLSAFSYHFRFGAETLKAIFGGDILRFFYKKPMSGTVVIRMVLESYNDSLSVAKITFKFDEINIISD